MTLSAENLQYIRTRMDNQRVIKFGDTIINSPSIVASKYSKMTNDEITSEREQFEADMATAQFDLQRAKTIFGKYGVSQL